MLLKYLYNNKKTYLYNNKKTYLFKFEHILFVFWIGCLLSVNSKISDLNIPDQNPLEIFLISIRIIFPVLVFLILFFFLKLKKLDLFSFSYLVFASWQLAILLTSKVNLIIDLEKYHLIISMMSILLIMHVVKYSNFIYLETKILLFSIFFIACISFYFSTLIIFEFIKSREIFYLYWNTTTISEGRSLLQTNPRITGVSRMLGLVLFFIFSMFICNKRNKIKNLLLTALMFIISFLLYGMQSKGSYLSILVMLIYYIFFFKDEIKKKFYILFIILILPILAFETVIKIKVYSINKMKFEEFKQSNIHEFKKLDESYFKSRLFNKHTVEINGTMQNDYTTGRYEIWSRALKIIQEKKILIGYGPQADRMLLGSKIFDKQKPSHFFDSNASNGLIYSYLCAGVIGLLFILSIYLLIFFELYKSIFIKKAFIKKKVNIIFSILTLTFLSLRTFYENGYTLFGVDFIFAIITYTLLKESNLRNKV